MIAVADASWRYAASSEPTLEHIDLAVEPGEAVVLCGASGSGKSTLLRMMNGLIPHLHEGSLSGGVTVAGLDVAASPLEEIGRRTGTVLQHPRRQFFTATAVEETAFAMENFGTAPERIRARVDAVTRRLGIHDLADRPLAHLSGGMQQRVAVAAALAHEPGLLLLDEPSSNLSADAVENLAGVLRELRRLGITIVLSEHRLHHLAPVVDRFVLLERGRIAREWSAEQILYRTPTWPPTGCATSERPRRRRCPPSSRTGRALRPAARMTVPGFRPPLRSSGRRAAGRRRGAGSDSRMCAAPSGDAPCSPSTTPSSPPGG